MNKDEHIKQAGLEDFIDIKKLLSVYAQDLQESYKSVNKMIRDKTPHIIYHSGHSFTLRTPKSKDKDIYSISSIIPYKKDIPIQSVLSIVNEQTKFLEKFINNIPSQQYNRPEDNTLYATLIFMV